MVTPITSMSESSTFPRTPMPAETTPSLRQSTSETHQIPHAVDFQLVVCMCNDHKVRFANQENR